MKRIIHHVKRHWKTVHKHVRKHHPKYIFGAISGALVYKTLALILTTAAITPMWVTFASWTADTWTVYTGTVLAGDFVVNNNDSSTTWLDVTINNNIIWATHMRFWNTESDRNIASWDVYSDIQNWLLDDNGTWIKIVYGQFSGNNSSWESIILDLQDTIEYIIAEINTWSIQTWEVNTWTVDTWTVFLADTTPDTISFTDVLNADLTTEYFSNTVDITWINTWIEISITGDSWMYKINSGSRTNSGWLIYSGDTVQIKILSSDNYSTQVELTLSVWDSNTIWAITTQDENIVITCDANDISIVNPLPGDITKWEFDIQRSYSNTDCSSDEFTIKLRDANTQYITLWVVNYNDTNNSELTFDSSMLYSWFYNIYSWVDLSGNNILVYTWDYSWVNTKYFSWHKIAILNMAGETMYEWDYFTIDNLNPEINNITLDIVNENNGYVWLDWTINLSFDSSEELSWVQVTILWAYANLESHTNNTYTYTMDLSPNNTAWSIIYNIEFKDLAWNTWYVEWNNNTYFDNNAPFINNLEFTHSSSIVSLVLSTDENSKVDFAYNISGSNIWWTFESEYTLSHNHIFTGIQSDEIYNYTLSIYDNVNNTIYIWWYFTISGANIIYDYEVISSDDMIVDTWFQNPEDDDTTESTGTVISTSPANTFKTEIEKFKMCKESLTNTTTLEIPVRKYKARLEMPELEKSYVRKLVSAFSIVLFERIAEAWLSEEEINDLTKEFNNFLVILKLVRDDENQCEQNLSNYYMSKFRKSLVEYNLATD